MFIYTAATDVSGTTPTAGPSAEGFASVVVIAQPGGYLTALGTVGTLAGIVLLVLWAIATASDYSTGLIPSPRSGTAQPC